MGEGIEGEGKERTPGGRCRLLEAQTGQAGTASYLLATLSYTLWQKWVRDDHASVLHLIVEELLLRSSIWRADASLGIATVGRGRDWDCGCMDAGSSCAMSHLSPLPLLRRTQSLGYLQRMRQERRGCNGRGLRATHATSGKSAGKSCAGTYRLFRFFFTCNGTALVRLLPRCVVNAAGTTNASSSELCRASSICSGSSSEEIVYIFGISAPSGCNTVPHDEHGQQNSFSTAIPTTLFHIQDMCVMLQPPGQTNRCCRCCRYCCCYRCCCCRCCCRRRCCCCCRCCRRLGLRSSIKFLLCRALLQKMDLSHLTFG